MAFDDTNSFSIVIDPAGLITAGGTGNAQNATGSGLSEKIITADGTGTAQSATGSGAIASVIDVSGVGNAQNATGDGNVVEVADVILAFGTVTAQNATGSGNTDISGLFTASGVANADNATGSGLADPIRVASGTADAGSATGIGHVERIHNASGVGTSQPATGFGNVFLRTLVTASGIGNSQNATGSGTVGGLIDPPFDLRLKTPSGEWIEITNHQNLTNIGPHDHHARFVWNASYVPGASSLQGDAVLDNGWTMHANKDTGERAAPQATGDPFYAYDGTLTPQSQSAKQLIAGARYTPQNDTALIIGYRVYTEAGQDYHIVSVSDPDGARVIRQLVNFTANSTGWQEFSIAPTFITVGSVLDIVAVVNEPPASPVTFSGNWNYTTPNNEDVPGAGVVIHANRLPSSFRINKTDNDAGDRSAELGALTVGDVIDWGGGGTRWAIQQITDNGTWFDFTVSPATQESPDGVRNLTFETVVAVPIEYQNDVDFWLGNPAVRGLYGFDTDYDSLVPDDTQYIIDVQLQDYTLSPDWDVVAYSGASSAITGGGGGLSPHDLSFHDDCSIVAPVLEQSLTYNGTTWVNQDKIENAPGSKFVKLTQAEYDALGPGRDSNIQYIVVG